MQVDPDFANPGLLVATAVEDAFQLETIRGKWFQSLTDRGPESIRLYPGRKDVQAAVGKLIEKVRGLDYAQAWAVIIAVRWCLEQRDRIDVENVPWWTLAFRREWNEKHSSNEELESTGKPSAQKRSGPEAARPKHRSSR